MWRWWDGDDGEGFDSFGPQDKESVNMSYKQTPVTFSANLHQ